MVPMLFSVSGPLKGVLFRLTEEEVSIGRHSSNQLCIGDLPVSRNHCVIRNKQGRFVIQDLDSNNGTFVNRAMISEHILADGDEIDIGSTRFQFVAQQPGERIELHGCLKAADPDLSPESTIRVRKEDQIFSAKDPQADTARPAVVNAFSKIASILDSTQQTDDIETRLLKIVCDVIPAEQGALVIADSFAGDKGPIFAWRRDIGLCTVPRVSQAVIDTVVSERSSVMTNNLRGGRTKGPDADEPAVTSILAALLSIRGKLLGVVYLDTTDPMQRFTKDDLEFVNAISSFLALALDHSRRLQNLEIEKHRLQEAAGSQHEMLGRSTAMQKAFSRIARIAPTDATVLIGGETGTGKELAARAIHYSSPRAGRPFEAINCALLNDAMLESELFGHERGAFTSAIAQKKGKLEIADTGTVFLDEVGELPLSSQSMLLRVLQDRTFYRLGGTRRIEVNIRIIAATNKDLEEQVLKKLFREDLFYRLNVVSLIMPPLRDRREDIPLLAGHCLARAAERNKLRPRGISPRTIRFLQAYDWPGNVREFENAIEYALVFGCSEDIEPEDLPERLIEKASVVADAPVLRYQDAVRESKKGIVVGALQKANGNYGEAADLLDIHVNNLHRLVREFDLKSSLQRGKAAN